MKSLIFQAIFVISFIMGINSCSNSNYETGELNTLSSNKYLEKSFEQLTQIAIKDSVVTFRMDSLTTFVWDTLVIIKPFFPLDSLNRLVQIDLSQIVNKPTLSDDGINVLVFIKNNRIVDVVRLPRDKGDFWNEEVNLVTVKENCDFKFMRGSQHNSFVEAKNNK